jgi:hypothetical protein
MTADINAVLQQAVDQRLWGQVQLDYQDGKVVLIRKTETFKPNPTKGTTHDLSNRL